MMPADASSASPPLALAIVNARVWTGRPDRPWMDAVLVRDGRVLAVGSSAELRKRAGTTARVIDAGRRLLLASNPDAAIVAGAAADLTLVDDLVAMVRPTRLDEESIVLVVSAGRVVLDRVSVPS
jgi:predicted amidohydrolase YtcJ